MCLFVCHLAVKDDEAFAIARLLAKKDGVLTGISSGAAAAAAVKLAHRPENEGKNIVVLLPDGCYLNSSGRNWLR